MDEQGGGVGEVQGVTPTPDISNTPNESADTQVVVTATNETIPVSETVVDEISEVVLTQMPTADEVVSTSEHGTAENQPLDMHAVTEGAEQAAPTPSVVETPLVTEPVAEAGTVPQEKVEDVLKDDELPPSPVEQSIETVEPVSAPVAPTPSTTEVVRPAVQTGEVASAAETKTGTVERVEKIETTQDDEKSSPVKNEVEKVEQKPAENIQKKVEPTESKKEVATEKVEHVQKPVPSEEVTPAKAAAQLTLSEILARLSPQEVKAVFKKYLLEIGKKGREKQRAQHKEKQEQVLEYIRTHGRITHKEVRAITKTAKTTATRLLQQLEDQGKIVQHGGYRAHDAYYTIK